MFVEPPELPMMLMELVELHSLKWLGPNLKNCPKDKADALQRLVDAHYKDAMQKGKPFGQGVEVQELALDELEADMDAESDNSLESKS